MLEKVILVESVHEFWDERGSTILSLGQEVLSITAG